MEAQGTWGAEQTCWASYWSHSGKKTNDQNRSFCSTQGAGRDVEEQGKLLKLCIVIEI